MKKMSPGKSRLEPFLIASVGLAIQDKSTIYRLGLVSERTKTGIGIMWRTSGFLDSLNDEEQFVMQSSLVPNINTLVVIGDIRYSFGYDPLFDITTRYDLRMQKKRFLSRSYNQFLVALEEAKNKQITGLWLERLSYDNLEVLLDNAAVDVLAKVQVLELSLESRYERMRDIPLDALDLTEFPGLKKLVISRLEYHGLVIFFASPIQHLTLITPQVHLSDEKLLRDIWDACFQNNVPFPRVVILVTDIIYLERDCTKVRKWIERYAREKSKMEQDRNEINRLLYESVIVRAIHAKQRYLGTRERVGILD